MYIRALHPLHIREYKAGEPFQVADGLGRQLISAGLAKKEEETQRKRGRPAGGKK